MAILVLGWPWLAMGGWMLSMVTEEACATQQQRREALGKRRRTKLLADHGSLGLEPGD